MAVASKGNGFTFTSNLSGLEKAATDVFSVADGVSIGTLARWKLPFMTPLAVPNSQPLMYSKASPGRKTGS